MFASEMQNSNSLNETPNSLNLNYLSDCVFSLRVLSIQTLLSPDANLFDDPRLGCALLFVIFDCYLLTPPALSVYVATFFSIFRLFSHLALCTL